MKKKNKKMGGVAGNRLNRIDNLFPLCRSCHNQVHKNKGINEKLKLILKDKIHKKEVRDFFTRQSVAPYTVVAIVLDNT